MNHLCQRTQPSAVGLPDFIQNAAKCAHSHAHMYAQSRCDPQFLFCFCLPPTSVAYLMAHVLASAAFSATKLMH